MILTVENQEHIHNIDFSNIIHNVNLNDLVEYIQTIPTEDWVLNCYWNKDTEFITYGEMCWVIYSYLVSSKILLIENKHYIKRNGLGQHPNEYLEIYSYYNTLESSLYNPILNRFIENNYLVPDLIHKPHYKLNHKVFRKQKLNRILKMIN